jgi:hypothetical protein
MLPELSIINRKEDVGLFCWLVVSLHARMFGAMATTVVGTTMVSLLKVSGHAENDITHLFTVAENDVVFAIKHIAKKYTKFFI